MRKPPVAAGAGIPPLPDGREEYHLTFLEDEGLTRRLVKELKAVGHDAELTWPEFKRDPAGFTGRMLVAYGGAAQKFVKQDNTVPALVAPFIVAIIVAGVWAGIVFRCNFMRLVGRQCVETVAENPYENLELVGYVENEIPKEQPTPDKGHCGHERREGRRLEAEAGEACGRRRRRTSGAGSGLGRQAADGAVGSAADLDGEPEASAAEPAPADAGDDAGRPDARQG